MHLVALGSLAARLLIRNDHGKRNYVGITQHFTIRLVGRLTCSNENFPSSDAITENFSVRRLQHKTWERYTNMLHSDMYRCLTAINLQMYRESTEVG